MMERPRPPPPCPARPQAPPRSEIPEAAPKCPPLKPPRPSEAPVPSTSVLPTTPPLNSNRPTKPPPIPSRPDLGEGTVDTDQSRCEDKSQTEPSNKQSPALGPKGRPEITVNSARPMNSPDVPHPGDSQPAPPLTSCGAKTAETEDELPQKPARRTKARAPPPRPKSRPVSDLPAVGVTPPLLVAVEEANKVKNNSDNMDQGGTATVTTGIQAPPRRNKQPSVIRSEGQESAQEDGTRKTVDGVGGPVLEQGEAPKLKKRAAPTVIRAEQGEEPECDSRPPPQGVEKQDGEILSSVVAAETDDSNTRKEGRCEAPTRTKKPKPTVILAKTTKTEEGPQDKSDLPESERRQKPAPKPPPPTVKPRPASIKRPPASVQDESKEKKKEDSAPSLTKPKNKLTIITAKPGVETQGLKTSEGDGASETTGKRQPPGKPPSPSPPVKAKRLPTVIQPKKPDSSRSENGATAEKPSAREQPSPNAGRKPPEKPARGPSIKRPDKPKPPQRPVTMPAESNTERSTIWYVSLDDAPPETVKSTGPDRGDEVSVSGHKDGENAAEKVTENGAAELSGKNSQDSRVGPPLRPAPRRTSRKEETPVSNGGVADVTAAETADDKEGRGTRPKPPPPRPNPAKRSGGEGSQSTHEPAAKPVKPRPPRPASLLDQQDVSRDATAGSAEEENLHKPDKVKPKVAPRRRPSSQSTGEQENESKESLTKAENHVQVTPEARDQESRHENEASDDHDSSHDQKPAGEHPLTSTDEEVHQTKEAKTKPPRPASAVDKIPEKGADIPADVKTEGKSKPKPQRPPAAVVKSKPPRPAGVKRQTSKEDLTKSSPPVEPTPLSSVCPTKVDPSAIALHDYQSGASDDLQFKAGDEIILIRKVDRDWYVGKCDSQEGLFPVKYVEIIEDLPDDVESAPETALQSSVLSSIPHSSVTALYDFAGDVANDELVFNAGDVIHVLEKVNDDWLKGKCNGKTGIFPANFVNWDETKENKPPIADQTDDEPKQAPSHVSGPRCTALFDFDAGAAGDLSFKLGDVIELKERINEEWLEGKLNGQVGTFPVAFVEILEDLPPTPTQTVAATNDTVEYVIAQYDYAGDTAEDLSFNKGDKIVVTERVSAEWLKGELRGQQGMFPTVFVGDIAEEKTSLHSSQTQVEKPQARALYDYEGETEEDLSFKSGDVIGLLSRVSDDWLKGSRDSYVGLFPASFVEILIPLP